MNAGSTSYEAEIAQLRAQVYRLQQCLSDRRRTIKVLEHRAMTAEADRTMLEGIVEGYKRREAF